MPPGDYKLSLDSASLPPNYTAPIDTFPIHVNPVSTVLQEIPVRALRSISGRVLLKVVTGADREKSALAKSGRQTSNPAKSKGPVSSDESQNFTFVPVAGAQIAAGSRSSVTDAEGKFVLRNLPAGDLNVTIQPVKPVPDGIKIPSGTVRLPAEPVQVEGATIVISNPELLPYLTRGISNSPAGSAQQELASTQKPERKIKEPQAGPAALISNVTTAKPATESQPQAKSPAHAAMMAPNPSAVPAGSALNATQPDNVVALPLPLKAATVQPPSTGVTESAHDRSSTNASLTREYCTKLPSLGEVAQCLRQLKLNTTTTSAH